MWRKVELAIPADMRAITCSMVPVHPWVYGVGQPAGDGSYLSPTNAINYLAGKIATESDEFSAVIYMVCAPTHTEFMALLGQFSTVFPLPAFTQVSRRAKEAATLATTKMQLPGNAMEGLPLPQTLSTVTHRLAINAQRIAQAKNEAASGASLAGVQSAMSAFREVREATLNLINQASSALQGQRTPAWVFTAQGNAPYVVSQMKKNIPQQDAIFTLATLFVGQDLDVLEAMIHDNHRIRA